MFLLGPAICGSPLLAQSNRYAQLITISCVFLFRKVEQLEQRIDILAGQLVEIRLQNGYYGQTFGRNGSLTYPGMDQTGDARYGSDTTDEGNTLSGQTDTTRKVYLTFDDGPSIYTDEILDILKEYHVKATFFVVGKEDAASQKAIRRIVAEGHTLGMHSYSHKYSELYASREAFQEDFEKERDYLETLTGSKIAFYRFFESLLCPPNYMLTNLKIDNLSLHLK